MWRTKPVSENERGEGVKEKKIHTWTNEPLWEGSRTLRVACILRGYGVMGVSLSLKGYILMEYKHPYVGAIGSVRTDYSDESTD